MDDNYPTGSDNIQTSDIEGWKIEADEAKQLDESKENAKLASSIGVIEDVMRWLEHKRRDYEGIRIIAGVTPGSKAEDIKSAVLLNQQMLSELDALLRDFRIEYAKYITEVPME